MNAAQATATQTQTRPLAGIRVLAIEGFIAGPFASMWLADMGAEVIKIEPPGSGDAARSLPPFRGEMDDRRSLSMFRSNRNKKSLTLNMKTDEGRAIFERLVAVSDVLIENLRPDALERLGFGFEKLSALNPRLVYTSISGFGHQDMMPGPYTDWPALDVIALAMAGIMSRPEGGEHGPVYVGFPLADLYASTVAVCGTLQALFHRVVTDLGQRVDIAMYDTSLVLNELALIMETATGVVAKPGLHALTAPFGSFRGRDGSVAIAVMGERIWQNFCTAIGRPDLGADPDLQNGVDRHGQAQRLREITEAWLQERSVDEAVRQLVARGVPAAPVQTIADIVSCPQVEARNMLLTIEDAAWGKVRVVGQPIKASGALPPEAKAPPKLGEHSRQLLKELASVDENEFDRLQELGIV